MAQTETDRHFEFIAFCQKTGQNQKGRTFSALPCLWTRVGAQVALQRCPILRTSTISLPLSPTSPSARGHLYFAEKGTFLFCIDRDEIKD
jgi:hypothetical protein